MAYLFSRGKPFFFCAIFSVCFPRLAIHQPQKRGSVYGFLRAVSHKLTSPRCWSPRAELKTQREYGFGLGPLTVTSRFNRFEDAKQLDASLKTWQWSQRYATQATACAGVDGKRLISPF